MSDLVIDTSAAVAILTSEPGADELIDQMAEATGRRMSTATLVELSIVMEARLGPPGQGIVERFLRDSDDFAATDIDVVRPTEQ